MSTAPSKLAPAGKAKKGHRRRLAHVLRELMGSAATPEVIQNVAPEMLTQLRPGASVPTVADLLCNKLVKFALAPDSANQWAVEMVFQYVDGKAVQAAPVREDGRIVNDRLDDITKQHLNALAAQFAPAGRPPGASQGTQDAPAGPAPQLVDLPRQRVGRPQAAEGESAVEAEPEGGD